MSPVLSRGLPLLALLLALLALATTLLPQRGDALTVVNPWPTRPVTIIVTFPPGGGTDLLARKLGERLAQRLGQPVVIENRPGASGNLGARAVVDAPADGHTLLMVNSSYAVNPAVFRQLPFSPRDDLQALANVAYVPSVLVVPAASPAQTLQDWLQAEPGQAAPAYASCGNGTPQHLAGEMLGRASARALLHVPYRGCGPALQDVTAGQVSAAIITASSAAPFLASGHVRALALTAPARSPLLPEIPTVAESGFPGYALDQWHGLLARTGTPAAVMNTLQQHLAVIAEDPALRTELRALGFQPVYQAGAGFQQEILADIDRFTVLAREIGLQVD